MKKFKNGLLVMVKNIEFQNVKNEFSGILKEKINAIKTSDKIFLAAGKTRHIYKMEKQQYTKLLIENITKNL